MAVKPEALAIVLDVNPSMSEAEPGEKSPLEKCITAANMIVQRKIFADTKKNKDEAAIILFGTDGTSNPLNDGTGEGYSNVTLAQDLQVMDLNLLRFINTQIVSGNSSADFLDALVVAMDHLRNRCLGRKMEQKIVLFSNMACEFGADQLEMIVAGLKSNNVNMIFVGPEMDDDDDQPGPSHRGPRKPLSPQQIQGLNCVRHILDNVDGEGMSISEVLPMLSFFEKRRRKTVTTFRGPIEIGSSLKINTYAYVKVSEEKPSSWKKLSALAQSTGKSNSMLVDMQRTYHHKDEEQTEVKAEDTTQAYRYGKTLVPMTTDDQKQMKLDTEKGCLVLGFTSQDNIERHLYSRNGCHIFFPQPDDEHAAIAFSAFCHALLEKNMVAIVRYVARANSEPKVGFLAPHIKSSYESLIFVALPYREDVRQYQFASLDNVKPPSDEQIVAMDTFIDEMSLVKTIVVDDEEEKEELFKPKDILNPITQRQCQCIQSRALNPDEVVIPEVDDYIARSLRPVPEMLERCQMYIDQIKNGFPITVVKKKTDDLNIFQTGKDEEKKANPVDGSDFSFANLSRNQISEVGTARPIEDFKLLIENSNDTRFIEVCEQLRRCIVKLVLNSILSQYYEKAVECMRVFKDKCVKRRISQAFNKLLMELKDETYGKRKDDFWQLLVKENITPMSQCEAADSLYSAEQAEQFFASEQPVVVEEVREQEIDDAEDLLDML